MQVFELADELGVRSIDVVDACADVGLAGMSAGSELTDDQIKRVRFAFNQREAAEVMAQAVTVERSTAPVLQPIVDPYQPVGPPVGQPMGPPPDPSGAPPHTWPTPRPVSKGMHPLIKRALWHFVLGQVVPCVGLYFLISSLVLAGKGRRQIAWSGGRYSGDTAGLVIQIVVWVELAFSALMILVVLATSGGRTQ